MFVIIVPASACRAPTVIVLFWADWGQKIGDSGAPHFTRIIDAVGLLLGTAFALGLLRFTLYTEVKDGWQYPSPIAMFVVGGVLPSGTQSSVQNLGNAFNSTQLAEIYGSILVAPW
ncbi:hypothetical protein B0H15DRAFT_957367 [Mycena belliarum]|uniref:Uncharacterized protein n=1 Tax=Mycena belliarum TaxID=1033014 RepID=A0AAD6TPE3_9AGAR|nr:hypothetical protein B0H15DRAFT_957367 [Mycena belliae]